MLEQRRFPPQSSSTPAVVKDSAGQKLRMSILRKNPAVARRPSYSLKMRRGGLRISPSYSAKMEHGGSRRQAVSLSSWLQCLHRKMRISVSPPGPGTIAIKFILAVQRQSGSSVEPASSRRSNFDMTPPVPSEV